MIKVIYWDHHREEDNAQVMECQNMGRAMRVTAFLKQLNLAVMGLYDIESKVFFIPLFEKDQEKIKKEAEMGKELAEKMKESGTEIKQVAGMPVTLVQPLATGEKFKPNEVGTLIEKLLKSLEGQPFNPQYFKHLFTEAFNGYFIRRIPKEWHKLRYELFFSAEAFNIEPRNIFTALILHEEYKPWQEVKNKDTVLTERYLYEKSGENILVRRTGNTNAPGKLILKK